MAVDLATQYTIMLWSGIMFGIMSLLFFVLAKDMIVARLKSKLLSRKGFVMFGILTYAGDIRYFSRRAGGKVKYGGHTYIYNQKPEYNFGNGGNFYIEGKSEPVNTNKLRDKIAALGMDAKRFDVLLKRERALGKLEGQKEDKREFLMIIGILGITGINLVLTFLMYGATAA